MSQLLEAAVKYAVENGATIVEGYPVDPGEAGLRGYQGYTGIISTYRQVGFVEVLRMMKIKLAEVGYKTFGGRHPGRFTPMLIV